MCQKCRHLGLHMQFLQVKSWLKSGLECLCEWGSPSNFAQRYNFSRYNSWCAKWKCLGYVTLLHWGYTFTLQQLNQIPLKGMPHHLSCYTDKYSMALQKIDIFHMDFKLYLYTCMISISTKAASEENSWHSSVRKKNRSLLILQNGAL